MYGHPDIIDVQVVGVPDALHGEAVCAFVRPRPGANVTAEQVRSFCDGRIAHFKIPRHVLIVDEFPMAVTGKIQKYRLREIASGQLAR